MRKVSIIIPMKNAESFIAETIQSLFLQNCEDIEILVVNDKSTDQSCAIVKSFQDKRLKLIHSNGVGISAAFNTGVEHAEGDFICKCDADDLYPEKRLSTQLAWLEENPNFGAICGSYSTIDINSNPILQYNCGEEPEEITKEINKGKTRTSFCTFMVKKDVLQAVRGCREYFITAEDIDLQYRLAEQTRIFYQPANEYFYRLHESSITHASSDSRRVFFDQQAELFRQQRLGGGSDDLMKGIIKPPPENIGKKNNVASQIQGNLMGAAWRKHKEGLKVEGIKIMWRAFITKPLSLSAVKNMLLIIIK